MDCWTVLQLDDDADERTIKRAYARLIKNCRPDEDAEGFQRVREAYEQALSYARWQAEHQQEEEEEERQTDVVEQSHGHFNDLAELMDVSTLRPAPLEARELDPAHALLQGVGLHNLDERWAQAQQQGCGDAFQAGLLRHCFEAPGERSAIVHWATQHLEWLTPWQRVSMAPWQHQALVSQLLQEYRDHLQALLAQKAEREFVTALTQYNSQPWLRVFDLQQQWQQSILRLLHDSQWSVPLFERVCQAFGWDDQQGIHPEPTWIWRDLVSRCEQESFYANLQEKAQDTRRMSVDAQAARLLLTPMSATKQMRLISGFSDAHWNACQQLGETLTWRYPQLLERLPEADAFFWRKFRIRPIYTHVFIRLWAIFALGAGLNLIHDDSGKLDAGVVVILLALLIVPAVVGFRLTQMWAGMSWSFIIQDLWLSQHLIPKRLNPNGYWLVLRHGVPQLCMLLACGLILGVLGMVTYAGMVLISLLHPKRIGQMSARVSQYPWVNGLHWAFWSPLQVVFLVVMVAVMLAAQYYLPAVPWTHFNLQKH